MMKLNVISNVQAKVTMTASTKISHKPRVKRNHATCFLLVWTPYKNADVPARKTNTGAQKCVIQRVKKSNGVVVARFVGSAYQVPSPKYMRTWSSAMITITTPRRRSMDKILPGALFDGSVCIRLFYHEP